MKIHLALAALALGLASCGNEAESTSDTGSGQEQTSYQFGVIAKSQSNQVFQAARTGAQDAARDLSAKYPNVDVEVKWQTPTDEDAQKQAQFIESLTSQGIDGITVSVSNAEILTGAINEAVRMGVEVVCFDSDAPESDRFAYYGIDDIAAGRKVMEELAKAMGEEGVVAILAGNQNAPNLQKRVQGVIEKASDYPNITIKETYYHQETPDQAAAKVQQVQNANPDITGWAMVGGWPLFTTNALDGVHEHASVVSVDHLPAQLDYVRDGQVQALVGQDCYGWGYQTVVMLFEKVHLGKTPDNVINTFDLSVVNQDNVEEYEGTWEQWLQGS